MIDPLFVASEVARLGSEARNHRMARRIKTTDVARVLGVGTPAIVTLENGTDSPSLRVLLGYGRLLGLQLNWSSYVTFDVTYEDYYA